MVKKKKKEKKKKKKKKNHYLCKSQTVLAEPPTALDEQMSNMTYLTTKAYRLRLLSNK